MAKETRKQKLQRYCKENKIKFQNNDTISMLLNDLAHELGINPKSVKNAKDLETIIENRLAEKAAKSPKASGSAEKDDKKSEPKEEQPSVKNDDTNPKVAKEKKPAGKKKGDKKKPTNKKGKEKKSAVKKATTAKKAPVKKERPSDETPKLKKETKKDAPKQESSGDVKSKSHTPKEEKKAEAKSKAKTKKPAVQFPEFKNVAEMKQFCVKTQLHKVEGYIPASKKKKTEFLDWMLKHQDKAQKPSAPSPTQNNAVESGSAQSNNSPANNPNNKPAPPSNNDVTPAVDTLGEKEGMPSSNEIHIEVLENEESVHQGVSNNIVGEDNPFIPKPSIDDMKSICASIMGHVNDSFQVRLHGGMPVQEFKDFAGQSLQSYHHEVNYDGNGWIMTVSDNEGNEITVPSNGYLPIK